jgi:hypothetical protein
MQHEGVTPHAEINKGAMMARRFCASVRHNSDEGPGHSQSLLCARCYQRRHYIFRNVLAWDRVAAKSAILDADPAPTILPACRN